MAEYLYRGFKISYNIKTLDGNNGNNVFKADGTVYYLLKQPKSFSPINFHTEDNSYSAAEHAIKRMLENYINFELKNYYDMQAEKKLI